MKIEKIDYKDDSYKEVANSPNLDMDLIAIKLYKCDRTPQSSQEEILKKELDAKKQRGEVPDISWFD